MASPFDGQAAGHGEDSGFGNGGGHYVTSAEFGVGGGDVEHGALAAFFQPAAAAGHGAMDCSHQHYTDHGFKGPGGKVFGAGDKVAGGVVDQDIERPLLPDAGDHFLYTSGIADVADIGVDRAAGGSVKLFGGFLQHLLAASTDAKRGGTQFQKPPAHGFAQAGCATGNQDFFAGKKVVLKHGFP